MSPRPSTAGSYPEVSKCDVESPRGPLTIDAQTREPIQNIYIRRVEKTPRGLAYRDIATYTMVKDAADR